MTSLPIHYRRRLFQVVVIPVLAWLVSHFVSARIFPGQPNYRFPTQSFWMVAILIFCCWEVNTLIFRYLDVTYPFYKNPFKRIARQIFLGGMATFAVFCIVYFVLLLLRNANFAWLNFLTSLLICLLIATLINGAYVGAYLVQTIYWEKQQSSAALNETLAKLNQPQTLPLIAAQNEAIVVASGSQIFRMLPTDIAYFHSSGGMVQVIKTNGQVITTNDDSLAAFENKLLPAVFFQINRQFVVHWQAIRLVRDDANRKLVVQIMPALSQQATFEEITISRYRSAEFKKWIKSKS